MAFYDLMLNHCKPREAMANEYPGKRVHFKRAVAEGHVPETSANPNTMF